VRGVTESRDTFEHGELGSAHRTADGAEEQVAVPHRARGQDQKRVLVRMRAAQQLREFEEH
jgi:hypothetical protein